jgi:hypothetical protein
VFHHPSWQKLRWSLQLTKKNLATEMCCAVLYLVIGNILFCGMGHWIFTVIKIKKQADEELLVILKEINPNATVQDVKKKINASGTNFRKEKNKIESSKWSGAGKEDIYKNPNCWTFHELNFLGEVGGDLINRNESSMNTEQEVT